MGNTIEKILSAKSIRTSAEELQALTQQWESIQLLKNDFRSVELNDYDIAMTHTLGGAHDE
ncbi:hypothetical protein [Bacillus massiliigorillae]|uniref:hypothetical protein n=1 Tax=Bacillus massiliigorillae TaxID=1243664 RepID=UPI00039C321E|nr:hypothetical protein [Bacillus massiliigorillae]